MVDGSNDDRYAYARSLVEEGVADRVLFSRPLSETGRYTAPFDANCTSTPVLARDGRRFDVECFAPEVDATEGETTPSRA